MTKKKTAAAAVGKKSEQLTAAEKKDTAWWFWLVAACVKLLLIPSYRSTDFEVHRHWLALTHSLPLRQWYSDASSQWTLDYPPLFAYFEYLLSFPAAAVDPAIVDIAQHDYSTHSAVIFLRVSVVVTDLVLLIGTCLVARGIKDTARRRMVYVLLLWSPALLIVDHIHFQYNGYMLGMLLISLGLMAEGKDLSGGAIFTTLICSKHLFAVAAPVYFVYILRHYCRGGFWKSIWRLSMMGSAVVAVLGIAFGPFVHHGQMQQVLQRLFPFGRGLCHAYWAPNFWVFYIVLDKALTYISRRLHLFNIQAQTASFTGGLVGDSPSFALLPEVSPTMSLALVVFAMLPCLVQAWRFPRPKSIIRWVAYAYTCGFLFGWHVHEKASLHFVIPLGITAIESLKDARHYFLLATVSCYSMFPLLFEPQEYPIKVLLLVLHGVLMWAGFSSIFPEISAAKFNRMKTSKSPKRAGLLGWLDFLYLVGLIGVEIWGQFLHSRILGDRLPFVPLMIVSMYCAFGMLYSWAWQLKRILDCR